MPARMISDIEDVVEVPQAYPFEVSMSNPDAMKVIHAGGDFRQLWTIENNEGGIRKAANGLTSFRRFAPGLDPVYSITFPFRIQGETMQKEYGSRVNETPNNGKTLG